MAPTRHHHTHARHPQGTARARQRIAAQQAAQQRAQARRPWRISIAAAAAVLAILAGFAAVKLTSGTAAAARESPAPHNVVRQVTTVRRLSWRGCAAAAPSP